MQKSGKSQPVTRVEDRRFPTGRARRGTVAKAVQNVVASAPVARDCLTCTRIEEVRHMPDVTNAVLNAVRDASARNMVIPVTPHRVRNWLQAEADDAA